MNIKNRQEKLKNQISGYYDYCRKSKHCIHSDQSVKHDIVVSDKRKYGTHESTDKIRYKQYLSSLKTVCNRPSDWI